MLIDWRKEVNQDILSWNFPRKNLINKLSDLGHRAIVHSSAKYDRNLLASFSRFSDILSKRPQSGLNKLWLIFCILPLSRVRFIYETNLFSKFDIRPGQVTVLSKAARGKGSAFRENPCIKSNISPINFICQDVFLTKEDAATEGVLQEKVFLEISQNSRENTCGRGIAPQACKFIKKETLAQVFSCEFYEISKTTFFPEHLCATASVKV